MNPRRITVVVPTDGSQNAEVYSDVFSGEIRAIHYEKATYTDGVDFTITGEKHGDAIWTQTNVNASVTKYPRVPVQDETGADATLDGTVKMRAPVTLVHDRVKFVLAQGGANKTGTFHIIVV